MCCFEIVSSLSFFKIFGVFKTSSYTHKIGSWYLLGVLFKISDEQPRPFFLWEFPSG